MHLKIKLKNMKTTFATLIAALLFVSCSSNDMTNQTFEVNGKFVHVIPNCDNSNNPEINCNEMITFIDASTVDVLMDGSDVVQRAKYLKTNNKINVQVTNASVSFSVTSSSTLINVANGETWVKSN
jgi:hypothetical protein